MVEMFELSNINTYDDEYSDFEDDYEKYYEEFDTYSKYEIIPFSRWYYGKIANDMIKVEEPYIYDSYCDFKYENIVGDSDNENDEIF